MTILGPVIFASFLILPYKLANVEDRGIKTIAVIELDTLDQPVERKSMIFADIIPPNENLKFSYLNSVDTSQIDQMIEHGEYYAVMVLKQEMLDQHTSNVNFYTQKQPSIGIESYIVRSIENYLYDQNLLKQNLSPEEINALKSEVKLKTRKLEKGKFEEQKLTDLKRGIGYAAGFLIYFFIFFFGAQVMRGVIEEKTNRIVEVIITSVRPFQLMIGKIAGIALVGLTQFFAWILLTIGIYQYALHQFFPEQFRQNIEITTTQVENPINEAKPTLDSANDLKGITDLVPLREILFILGTFIFYFLGGYLLYGAMFAAIGSAVDSETDTQQFMLPVTIPLILSIIVMINAITNPEGQLVYWFSMIPFTSPVVMMARIPFHPPWTELVLSMTLLVGTFILMTWIAGKIYRTGILMYGKKASYRELFKWIRYKD
jgi:ABC-2 type transport system permease protein